MDWGTTLSDVFPGHEAGQPQAVLFGRHLVHGPKKENKLRYIIFNSKFTNYDNLGKLDRDQVKFITIRRRGKLLLERIDNCPHRDGKMSRSSVPEISIVPCAYMMKWFF